VAPQHGDCAQWLAQAAWLPLLPDSVQSCGTATQHAAAVCTHMQLRHKRHTTGVWCDTSRQQAASLTVSGSHID